MAVFWVLAPCALAEVNRRFRGACCPHYQGDDSALIMEAASRLPCHTAQQPRSMNLEIKSFRKWLDINSLFLKNSWFTAKGGQDNVSFEILMLLPKT
jgi:hypothetical protein